MWIVNFWVLCFNQIGNCYQDIEKQVHVSYTLLLCPMPHKKGEIAQSSLFHSDVADLKEEELQGDVEQGALFQADTIPARRSALTHVQHVPSEPLNATDLTQTGMFEEVEQLEIRTLADCFVTMKPIVEVTQKTEFGKTTKREEWKCTFTSPPDLWHMDNPAIIHVSAIDAETIKRAKAAKLQRGNYVTITGKVKSESEQPMGKNAEPRMITHLILIQINSIVRPSTAKTKTNIAPLRPRHG